MPEAYQNPGAYTDGRTFAEQVARTLDDLNRPDLVQAVPEYLRDAIRYWRRKPFFFSDVDNADTGGPAGTGTATGAPPPWAANTFFPQGAAIQAQATDGNTYVYVQLTFGGGVSGATQPSFTPALYPLPFQASFPVYAPGVGVTQDGTLLWANAAFLTGPAPPPGATSQIGIWTQLSTVPNWNQVTPPIDYAVPRLVEVTAANLRFELIPLTYRELRSYDVIRPAPITVYPVYWAWYQQMIYLWPYPNGFYPLTISYRSYMALPQAPSDSNYWTTVAERMIRCYARGFINRDYLANARQAADDFAEGDREFRALRAQSNQMQVLQKIPPSSW